MLKYLHKQRFAFCFLANANSGRYFKAFRIHIKVSAWI